MIRFEGLSTDAARALRTGTDAYGNRPERFISTGTGTPCRHCLSIVAKDRPYLLMAHRPFVGLHAYAETGPIFLCAEECAPPFDPHSIPDIMSLRHVLLRGYDRSERIVGGTGGVVPRKNLADHAETILTNPDVAFVQMRSASNNCWLCNIRRI